MTYRELKKHIYDVLYKSQGEYSAHASDEIMFYLAGKGKTELILHGDDSVPENTAALCLAACGRIEDGEPLAYVTGKTGFFGLTLNVTKDVLIPRPDTEFVCEKALEYMKKGARIADICCGSGCIGLSLLSKGAGKADFIDISEKALSVAQRNASDCGFEEKSHFYMRDALSDGLFSGLGGYDLIISNPPYIGTDEISGYELEREPRIALDGGPDGLMFYRSLLKTCPQALEKGGTVVFEIGFDQEDAMKKLCLKSGLSCEIFYDYGGNARACVINP